jgi:hypothetical protein
MLFIACIRVVVHDHYTAGKDLMRPKSPPTLHTMHAEAALLREIIFCCFSEDNLQIYRGLPHAA